MHFSLRLSLIVSVILLFGSNANAQCDEKEIINLRKTALIFGAKSYKNAQLKNPINDAICIADSLEKLGFVVVKKFDPSKREMETTVASWLTTLNDFDVALFYFSGHGIEYNGNNYLIPVDAELLSASDLYYQTVCANRVLDAMESKRAKFDIVILDACRTNPFAKSWSKGDGSSGLAEMVGHRGAFVGFAASPGHVADDGISSNNGVYTEAVLEHIMIPNLTIDQIFTKVNSRVREKTREGQIPYKNSSLGNDFCFSVRHTNYLVSRKGHQVLKMGETAQSLNCDTAYIINTEGKIFIKDLSRNSLFAALLNERAIFSKVYRGRTYLYGLNKDMNVLLVMSPDADSIIRKIVLRAPVFSAAIDEIDNRVYLAVNNAIEVLNLTTGEIQNKIPEISVSDVELSKDGKRVYSISATENQENTLNVANAKTGRILKKITVVGNAICVGNRYHISYDKKGEHEISVINADSWEVRTVLKRGITAVFQTDSDRYACGLCKNEVLVIDLQKAEIVNALPFESAPKATINRGDHFIYVWLPDEHISKLFSIQDLLENSEFSSEENFRKFKKDLANEYEIDSEYYNRTELPQRINQSVGGTVNALIDELGKKYKRQSGSGQFKIDNIHIAYSHRYGIVSIKDESKKIFPNFNGTIEGDKLTITISDKDSVEKFTDTLNSFDWLKLNIFIRKYFIDRISQLK